MDHGVVLHLRQAQARWEGSLSQASLCWGMAHSGPPSGGQAVEAPVQGDGREANSSSATRHADGFIWTLTPSITCPVG